MDDSYEITVTNAPLPYNITTKLERLSSFSGGFMLANAIGFGFSFVTAFFLFFVIKERETRYKLLQFVGGLKIWTFWLSQFIFDFLVYMLIAVVIMVIIACAQLDGLSTFYQLGN